MSVSLPTQPSRVLVAIDEICERFEDRWQGGAAPRLEDQLPADWPTEERAVLAGYLLRIELEYR